MGWRTESVREQRLELVTFCSEPGANIRALCRRCQVSQRVAYKWMARYQAEGVAGLEDRPRRRLAASPQHTGAEGEAAVLGVRDAHPVWGARKIAKVQDNEGWVLEIPALSTITAILRRHGRLRPGACGAQADTGALSTRGGQQPIVADGFQRSFRAGRAALSPLDHTR